MPKASEIAFSQFTSFLLVGDGGTKKTTFIGTCPSPIWLADADNGASVLAGREDVTVELFKEVSRDGKTAKSKPLMKWQAEAGWSEWGRAWPKLIASINEIGKAIDAGTNPYKTIGIDSLTMVTDVCLSYIVRENGGDFKDGRQMWGVFLNNMSELFSQLTAWPVIKVLTAHIKRDDNPIMQTSEHLPNVPGQFAGKVPVYFDEVYYTESGPKGFVIKTSQGSIRKQAKSRSFNIPDDTPTDYREVMKAAERVRAAAKK